MTAQICVNDILPLTNFVYMFRRIRVLDFALYSKCTHHEAFKTVNITATRCTKRFSVNKSSLRQTIYLILSPIFFQVRSFPPAYCVKLQFSSELPKTLKSFYMAYLHFFFQSNALKSFNLSTQIRSIKVIYRSLFYGKK